MKSTTVAFKAKTAFVKSKGLIGAVVMGLAVSFEVATLSSPVQASGLYAKQLGNIPCSTCHSKVGMASGTMYPLTYKGSYYKTNKRLPGSGGGGGYTPPGGGYTPPGGGYTPPGGGYTPPGGGYTPPPPRGGGYNPPPRRPVSDHVAWCQRKYRSYKVRTDQYRGYDGYDHYCVSPYGGKRYAPPPPRRPRYNPPRRPRYNPAPPIFIPPTRPGRMSCGEAKRVIRNQGYGRIRVQDCSGGRYTFFANRGGDLWRLRFRASTGVIYKRTRQ